MTTEPGGLLAVTNGTNGLPVTSIYSQTLRHIFPSAVSYRAVDLGQECQSQETLAEILNTEGSVVAQGIQQAASGQQKGQFLFQPLAYKLKHNGQLYVGPRCTKDHFNIAILGALEDGNLRGSKEWLPGDERACSSNSGTVRALRCGIGL